jgi:hypothetical protein
MYSYTTHTDGTISFGKKSFDLMEERTSSSLRDPNRVRQPMIRLGCSLFLFGIFSVQLYSLSLALVGRPTNRRISSKKYVHRVQEIRCHCS